MYYVVFLSFFCIQLFPTVFRVQVFQSLGFSGSRVRVQVLEVAPCQSVISIKLQSTDHKSNFYWHLAWVQKMSVLLRWVFSWEHRSSPPEVFLAKCVLKICCKFTAENPCQSVISITLQSNFIEITLRHGCSQVNGCVSVLSDLKIVNLHFLLTEDDNDVYLGSFQK